MAKKADLDTFIVDGLKDQVVAMNNPNCVDCNECCSMGAMLTDEEYEQLKKYLAKNKYGRMLYERGIRTIWKYISKGTIYWLCPFSYNKRCQIYSMRPQICRSFHCDRPQEENREFRDTYDRHSHTIADLFRKDSFDLFKKLKGGN